MLKKYIITIVFLLGSSICIAATQTCPDLSDDRHPSLDSEWHITSGEAAGKHTFKKVRIPRIYALNTNYAICFYSDKLTINKSGTFHKDKKAAGSWTRYILGGIEGFECSDSRTDCQFISQEDD